MAEIRTGSSEEDGCTLYIGEQVVITGLTRAEAVPAARRPVHTACIRLTAQFRPFRKRSFGYRLSAIG